MKAKQLITSLLAVTTLAVAGTSSAAVTAVGADVTTQANWRTAASLEGDNEYGTDGYIVYGLDRADSIYEQPWDGVTDNQTALPAEITGIAAPAGEGLWSGNGNFGQLEDPNNGNVLTAAPVTANGATGTATRVYTISRAAGTSLRLAILVASGDNENTTYTTTVNDGSGAVSLGPVAHTINGVHYHVYDISAGSTDIVVSQDATPQARGVTGFAFDNVIPEPSSLALLGLGGLLVARRRRA